LRLLIGLAGAAATLAVSAIAMTPAADVISCRMSVPARVLSGKPVTLKYTLANHGGIALNVLAWNTPFEGFFGRHLRVDGPTGPLAYRGALAKRGMPAREDYLRLAPAASVTARVNLAEAYAFTEPGIYRIAFDGPLLDITAARIPRPLEQHQPFILQCNAVSFELMPSR
jgi:hypothetical protein